MAIILLIIQIVTAIPQFIQLIKLILDLINQLPKGDRALYRAHLYALVKDLKAKGVTPDTVRAIHVFKDSIQLKVNNLG
jgi:hypothetical protein